VQCGAGRAAQPSGGRGRDPPLVGVDGLTSALLDYGRRHASITVSVHSGPTGWGSHSSAHQREGSASRLVRVPVSSSAFLLSVVPAHAGSADGQPHLKFIDDCGAGGGFLLNAFLLDGNDVYRTYSTTSRGVDRLLFHNNIHDLTVYGRQEDWEDSPNGWTQHPPYG